MKARLEAKLSMYHTVSDLAESSIHWLTAMTHIPIIATYRGQLSNAINSITSQAEATEASTIPITSNKEFLRRDMEGKATALASILYSYAKTHFTPGENPNTALLATVKPWRKKSAFAKLKDNITNVKAREILNLAMTITPASALVPYGFILNVTNPEDPIAGTLEKLEQAISSYYLAISTPEGAIESRKSANQRLKKLFKEADNIIDNLDSAIYPTQWITETYDLRDFYNDYKAARNIFDPANYYTGVKGTATDVVTGLPIKELLVRAISSPPLNESEMLTAEDGTYIVYTPKFKLNPYTLTFTKVGYQTKQVPEVFVERGKKFTLNVQMIPEIAE